MATRNTVSSETAIKIQHTQDYKENIFKGLRAFYIRFNFIKIKLLFLKRTHRVFFQSFHTGAIFLFVNEGIHGGKNKYFLNILLLVLKNDVGHFLEAVHWDTERWA